MTARDRRLLELTYDLGRADSLDDLRHTATYGTASVVGADLVGYTEVDLARQTVGGLIDREIPEFGPITAALGRLAHQHPLITRTETRAQTISDYLSWGDFSRLEIYDEVYRRLGARDQLAATVQAGEVVVGLALNRARPTFDARDRAALDTLAEFVRRGLRRVAALERGRALLNAIEERSQPDPVAVVALGEDGRIEYLSDRAGAWLAHYFPGARVGQVPEPVARWLAADHDGLPDVLVVDGDERRLEVRGARTADGGPPLLELRERVRPRENGLTPREREVVECVAEGHSNDDIAAALGLSRRTVEHHLQAAYRKLGVTNRSAAVARLRGR